MKSANTISIFFLFLVAVMMVPGQATAGDIWRGGSLYARFGAGLPHDTNAGFADGMGVYGVAIFESRHTNNANPAIWSRSLVSNASGLFEINSFQSTLGEEKTSVTQYQAGSFQLVLPVKRDRVGISLSISPLTSLRYQTFSDHAVSADQNHALEEIPYTTENTGSGGLNRLELGIGVRLTSSISVGYAPSLILGVLRHDQFVDFDHVDYRSLELRGRESHYGFGNRFGLFIQDDNVFGNNDRLSFGATVNLPVTLSSEKTLRSRVRGIEFDVHPDSYFGDGNAKLPMEIGAGFAYYFNPRFLVSSDILYQNWEEYRNYYGDQETYYKDRIRVGAGTQLIPGGRDASRFFSRFIYRLGVSYDTGHITLNDKNIESFRIHAGLGVPSSRTRSSFDISAEYGFMGTSKADLARERVFSLKVSFNLSELMFMQRLLQ
ncbi:hypothetical protein QLX67_07300 [Balneolaceae bacterium ANBcel3]|nr:hypothetical protein [Balneolaceae bacterium ANBcel3]